MLITDIATFQLYTETSFSVQYDSIKPSLEHAEAMYILPIIGRPLYIEISVEEFPEPVNEQHQALKALLQRALANLALYHYIPFAAAQVTDAGVRRSHSESMPTAYRYQQEQIQAAYLQRGLDALEIAIEYLETNIAVLPEWVAAPEFAQYRALFIRTGSEFAKYYSALRHPRRMYTLLRSAMVNTQELTIAKSIGNDLYQQLLAKSILEEPGFTDEESKLLVYLKRAIANYTVAQGITVLSATMDENGILLLSSNVDRESLDSKRAAAPAQIMDAIINYALGVGKAWLDKAIDYMNTTASSTVFVSWYNTIQSANDSTSDVNETLTGSFTM